MALFDGFPPDPAADPLPQPDPVAAAPGAHQRPPTNPHREISGHYSHSRRKAGTDSAAAVAAVFASLDDQIRATITSPTGRAYLQLPDGTLQVIEGMPLPGAAPETAPASAHPLQAVLDEFPEVAQPGTSANRLFHHAYRRAGSQPEHAQHIARTVLR